MTRFAPLLCALLLVAACTPVPSDGDPGESSSSAVVSSVASSAMDGDIIVDSPAPDAVVKSPLTVTGKARGTWYFEASFPVRLLDADGNELALVPAQAQGEWMTEDFVPFSATLTFATSAKAGTLVLQKDNPSGLPENDKSVSIPVRF